MPLRQAEVGCGCGCGRGCGCGCGCGRGRGRGRGREEEEMEMEMEMKVRVAKQYCNVQVLFYWSGCRELYIYSYSTDGHREGRPLPPTRREKTQPSFVGQELWEWNW